MSDTTDEKSAPRITAVVVHITCDRCALDDEFEFEPADLIAELSSPCACDRRIHVSASAEAFYTEEGLR